jgi:nitrile hydratase
MSIAAGDERRMLAALMRLLDAKGIASAADIAARVTATDAAHPGQGARMVARAWTDPEYRRLMLADGSAAAEAMGIPMRGLPPLGVLEATECVQPLVVCTLCSCFPRAVLGYPPFWFKSAAYRARAVRDPRGVLREFGTEMPESVRIEVVDSTADYRWMVLPVRPLGTEGWDAGMLTTLVGTEEMIGVRRPHAGTGRICAVSDKGPDPAGSDPVSG